MMREMTPPADEPRNAPAMPEPAARPAGADSRMLGDILVADGALDPGDLARALALQARETVRLGTILRVHGMVGEAALFSALERQWNAASLDPVAEPPDPRLIDVLAPGRCIRDGVLPWRRRGAVTVVACCRPDRFAGLEPGLRAAFGEVAMALCTEQALHDALMAQRRTALARTAETRVAEAESSRPLATPATRLRLLGFIAALVAFAVVLPGAALVAVFGWAVLMLLLTTGLKCAAAAAALRRGGPVEPAGPAVPRRQTRLPTISVMVPLYREQAVVHRLIPRLRRLNYPRELLDICLVMEAPDTTTATMLDAATLPSWMRVVTVPDGALRTKPRALNYALDFCYGDIIGVYDAEDAPAPEQLHRVAAGFAGTGPEVACLQGVLDYYNPRANWLSRCFTIEYATWFRLVLAGVSRLGMAIPLGGTTLFFRRQAVEMLGGWDAHNVTEDADLGIRLARHGYRAELIETVTEEEANCRVWPWVRQRSRWLKGYAMTWAVHSRHPCQLWRQLGPRKFLGFQIMFLGTLSQFLLGPALWSFWLLLLGLGHPLEPYLPRAAFLGLAGLFVASEAISIALSIVALRRAGKTWLIPWVPTMHLYFPIGALAAYKALYELIRRPFFWDKTTHGLHAGPEPAPAPA